MQTPLMVLLIGWFVVLGSSATPAATPLAADTPKETVLGNSFIAPAGWTISVREQATILTAPEGDSWIVLAPGAQGFQFVVAAGNQRRLIIRDAQHEYAFDERPR